MAVPGVKPSLLIIDASPAAPKSSVLRRLRSSTLFWNAYQRLWLAGRVKAQRSIDLGAQLNHVATIKCVPARIGKYSQVFSPADVEVIRSHELDFIIRFGFDIIRGDVLRAARYGVWSYHHGDLDQYRGMPACFWEIQRGDPVTGVTLQRLTDSLDAGIVLKKNYFPTVLKSYARNCDTAFFGSTDLPARVCRDILAGHADYVSGAPSKTTARVFHRPTNVETAVFLWRLVRNSFLDALQWLFFHRQWSIGIVDAPIHSFLNPEFKPSVRWLTGIPRAKFIADPFGIRLGKTTTILAEELHQAEQFGRLVAISWKDNMAPVIRRGILNLPVHASYPFLIQHDNEIYCVPETAQAREIVLYRAVQFPVTWERASTVVSGVAALDPTIVAFMGRWWMFYGIKGPSEEVQLCAMHAESLHGPWVPHPANPLKVDVRSSRPAGTPFVHKGILYRPAQDGSRIYGGAITLNKVTRLTTEEFEESAVSVINPPESGQYRAGVHTIADVGEQTLIDGQRVLFVPALFFAQARKIVRRFTRPREIAHHQATSEPRSKY